MIVDIRVDVPVANHVPIRQPLRLGRTCCLRFRLRDQLPDRLRDRLLGRLNRSFDRILGRLAHTASHLLQKPIDLGLHPPCIVPCRSILNIGANAASDTTGLLDLVGNPTDQRDRSDDQRHKVANIGQQVHEHFPRKTVTT
ncbi:MAG: hypothetical protein VB861_20450 [Planctomycetaceae bacterium]